MPKVAPLLADPRGEGDDAEADGDGHEAVAGAVWTAAAQASLVPPPQPSPQTARRRSRTGVVTATHTGWYELRANRPHVLLTEETGVAEESEANLVSMKSSRDWWAVLTTTQRILPNWRPCLVVLVVTTIFVLADRFGGAQLASQDIAAGVAGLTFVVGLLMSLRISDSWKNWYTARQSWQKMIGACSRFFQLCWASSTLTEDDEFTVAWRAKIYALTLAFPIVVKNLLRGSSVQCDARDLQFVLQGNPAARLMIPHILNPKQVPMARLRFRWVTLLMRGEVDHAYRRGVLSDAQMQIVHQLIPEFEDVASTCSLIKSTPFVFQAAVHFRTLLLLYCCSLPMLLLHSELDIITTYALVCIITIAILTLDEVAVRLEQPFGFDSTDLPIGEYINMIREEMDVTRHADLSGAMIQLDAAIARSSGELGSDITSLVCVVQKDKQSLLQTLHPQRTQIAQEYKSGVAEAETVARQATPSPTSPTSGTIVNSSTSLPPMRGPDPFDH